MDSNGATIRRDSDASDARRSAVPGLEPDDGSRDQDQHCHHHPESEEDRRTDHGHRRPASEPRRACVGCPGEQAACPASRPYHDHGRRPCLHRDRGHRLPHHILAFRPPLLPSALKGLVSSVRRPAPRRGSVRSRTTASRSRSWSRSGEPGRTAGRSRRHRRCTARPRWASRR